MPDYIERPPNWTPEERPTIPGSAASLAHRPVIRLAYALVALLVGLTGALGNALVSANLPNIQGHLGLTPAQGAWLPGAYVMVNVSVNLIMIKVRQQYGLRHFAELGLFIYLLAAIAHTFVDTFAMAVTVRAISGLAGAVCSTLAVLYMLQAFPKASLIKGLILGLGISQLATPIAWQLSPALLDLGQWHRLYVFDAGLAMCALAAVVVLKLPVSERIRVLEPLDFLTFVLVALGLAAIAAVLAQGRIQWWFDQAWLGWVLATAVMLLVTAWGIEHFRQRPLIQTRWLGTANIIRFAVGAFLLRLLTAEQTFGAVGLQQALGMAADQLQPLYGVMLLGLLIGIALSALTAGPKTLIPQILLAILLMGVSAWMDKDSTSLTRPQDLYLSQTLLSIASGMFLGPLLMVGIGPTLAKGPHYLVSFVVLFSMIQSLGGLSGSALFGTLQVYREHYHSTLINADVDPTNPVVANRLQLQSQLYAGQIEDPVLRQAQGTAQLAQTATREANVRAYNNVFATIGVLAALLFSWSLFHLVRNVRKARRQSDAAAASTGSQSTQHKQ